MERLDAGFVEVKNPFNALQTRRVSLLPEPGSDMPLFAFWTRDPASILENAGELERRGYRFFVMCTLNSYPSILEPNVPAAAVVIRTMKKLAQKITAERVIWRYDPVFLSDRTDFEFHRGNFANLAAALSVTVRRVIVSVYDEYPRAEKRLSLLEKNGSLKRLPHYAEKSLLPPLRGLLAELAAIARTQGMEIQSCAEEDLTDCGIPGGACIDGELIEKLFDVANPGRDRGQKRPHCLCAKSVDIGSYGNCPAGCLYCYAQ